MPNIVIPYKPRALQKTLHEQIDKHRFSVAVIHRRGGKTVMAINHLLRSALQNPLPNPRYVFLSPFRLQGKATAWDYIKQFAAKIPGTKFNESELRCDLPNGARITILGADNDQAIRGISLDGCVLDEFQNIKPTIFPEIIRPALADRARVGDPKRGFCIFIGTPKGQNNFYQMYQRAIKNPTWYACSYKASETGILADEELQAAKEVMSNDLYNQEFEVSFNAAINGSYYGAIIEDLVKEKRMVSNLYDEDIDVETWFDLGMNDQTAIWFVQRYKGEIRLIDYYENSGFGLDHYADVLKKKGFEYSTHIFPHDVKVRELGNYAKTRLEALLDLGIVGEVAPKLSIEDGIESVRKNLVNCWFDQDKCATGIEYLKAYQKKWDDKAQVFKSKPSHSYASHAADSFRTGIAGQQIELSNWKKGFEINTNYIV